MGFRKYYRYLKPAGCLWIGCLFWLLLIIYLIDKVLDEGAKYYGFDKCGKLVNEREHIKAHIKRKCITGDDIFTLDSCIYNILAEQDLKVKRVYSIGQNTYLVLGANVFVECGIVIYREYDPLKLKLVIYQYSERTRNTETKIMYYEK